MPTHSYIANPNDGCAWITGASSGIGRELASRLAQKGWDVAVTSRSEAALNSLKDEVKSAPGGLHVYAGDVADTELMAQHCAAISEAHGPIALMIANAGIYLPQDGLNCELAAFRKSLDVNLMGTFNTVLPVVEGMKQAGRGQIGIVSSVAGYRGLPTSAAYGATKAGLINFAESLKFDLDRIGVRIQLISPGFVDTPATQSNPFPMPYLISPEEAVDEILKGLRHPSRFEIAFPKAFVRQLKFLRLLPYGLYFRLIARNTGWNEKGPD